MKSCGHCGGYGKIFSKISHTETICGVCLGKGRIQETKRTLWKLKHSKRIYATV